MTAQGTPRDGTAVDTPATPRPRVVRVPATPGANPSSGPPPPTTRTATWPTWPPEPFPGPAEISPMRPAPVRVLTTKVATPPVRPAASQPAADPMPPATNAPEPAVAPEPAPNAHEPASERPRRGGEGPRGFRWTVLGTIVISLVIGGLLARMFTADDAEHTTTTATTTSPASTVPRSTVAPTTIAATTTAAPAVNPFGITVGTPAAADSARPEERFAAHLGTDDGQATPLSPASVYASWWKLFVGARPGAMASANGFAVSDAAGQSVELSAFVLGADGNVADLVECATGSGTGPTCNRLVNVVAVDAEQPKVGQSDTVTLRRLGELRLLRDRTVRFVSMVATQPVTAATSPAGDVRFDDHVLAVAVPSAAVPATFDVTLTYANGATETVTVTV